MKKPLLSFKMLNYRKSKWPYQNKTKWKLSKDKLINKNIDYGISSIIAPNNLKIY